MANNSKSSAEKIFQSFGNRVLGVSSLSSELAGAWGRAGGRRLLVALKLDAKKELTQKAVYNAIKKLYPFRNSDGKMCVPSAVVGGVFSPSVVSVVSVAFIDAILKGGTVVTLPEFYVSKGGKYYAVAGDYVKEGVNLSSNVRQLKETAKIADTDLQTAEIAHSRAVAGHLSDIEVQMALKAVGVASSNCAVAVKNHEEAVSEFEGWKGGLSAFVK